MSEIDGSSYEIGFTLLARNMSSISIATLAGCGTISFYAIIATKNATISDGVIHCVAVMKELKIVNPT